MTHAASEPPQAVNWQQITQPKPRDSRQEQAIDTGLAELARLGGFADDATAVLSFKREHETRRTN